MLSADNIICQAQLQQTPNNDVQTFHHGEDLARSRPASVRTNRGSYQFIWAIMAIAGMVS
jgi:hypothetical protein